MTFKIKCRYVSFPQMHQKCSKIEPISSMNFHFLSNLPEIIAVFNLSILALICNCFFSIEHKKCNFPFDVFTITSTKLHSFPSVLFTWSLKQLLDRNAKDEFHFLHKVLQPLRFSIHSRKYSTLGFRTSVYALLT